MRPLETLLVGSAPGCARLRELLAAEADVRIAASVATVADGRRVLTLGRVHLVFLELGVGREPALELLGAIPPGAHVVLVTEGHGLVRHLCVDLANHLVAPVTAAALAAVVAHARKLHRCDGGSGAPLPPPEVVA